MDNLFDCSIKKNYFLIDCNAVSSMVVQSKYFNFSIKCNGLLFTVKPLSKLLKFLKAS